MPCLFLNCRLFTFAWPLCWLLLRANSAFQMLLFSCTQLFLWYFKLKCRLFQWGHVMSSESCESAGFYEQWVINLACAGYIMCSMNTPVTSRGPRTLLRVLGWWMTVNEWWQWIGWWHSQWIDFFSVWTKNCNKTASVLSLPEVEFSFFSFFDMYFHHAPSRLSCKYM